MPCFSVEPDVKPRTSFQMNQATRHQSNKRIIGEMRYRRLTGL